MCGIETTQVFEIIPVNKKFRESLYEKVTFELRHRTPVSSLDVEKLQIFKEEKRLQCGESMA